MKNQNIISDIWENGYDNSSSSSLLILFDMKYDMLYHILHKSHEDVRQHILETNGFATIQLLNL